GLKIHLIALSFFFMSGFALAQPSDQSHFKKITKAPIESVDVEGAVAIKKPVITAAPAPGTTAPIAPKAHEENANVSAEKSLDMLVNGNTRFINKKFRADGKSAED